MRACVCAGAAVADAVRRDQRRRAGVHLRAGPQPPAQDARALAGPDRAVSQAGQIMPATVLYN